MAGVTAATKTYRYLRIGMAGTVALLIAAVTFERAEVDCWQTSVSAYYYTPVRAIFVGGLLAIGLSLIVIKGSTAWEDACLNVAGMLAPVVALVPTSNVGKCWSVEPNPLPVKPDGSLADWVVANIDNNIQALLVTGFAGLVVSFLIASVATVATKNLRAVAEIGETGTRLGLLIAFALIVVGYLAFRLWDDFDTKSHFVAAISMFVFLALAVSSNALQLRAKTDKRAYFRLYVGIAVLMVLAAAVLFTVTRDWDYKVLVLEASEIALFAAFWLVQTKEHWNETV